MGHLASRPQVILKKWQPFDCIAIFIRHLMRATGIGISRFPFASTRLQSIIAGGSERAPRIALDLDQDKIGDQP